MELTIFNERENSTQIITLTGNSVQELLQQLKINPETVLIVRNNEVLLRDEILQDGESIELLSVISGG